ncbi:MAG: DUF1593 domain-containing protein [Steroidobacteraceae bacterium]
MRMTATLGAGLLALLAATVCRAALPVYLETPPDQKPRVVITADPELDDSNSLVRYLLFSNGYRTEGLIYASSQFHWMGDGKGTKWFVEGREYTRFGLTDVCPCTSWRWNPKERFIDDAVETYAKAYPNLRVHDRSFPTPEYLKSKIRWGNVQFDGDFSKDTAGSNLIKALLLDNEESPIYLHAWGGQSTIARALKSIEDQYRGTSKWRAIRAKVIRKAVIHPSGDQDDTYARYIKPNWPEIRYRQLAGSMMLGYNAQSLVSEDDAAWFSADWTRRNISEKGPLGAFYRVWGDGRQMVRGDIFDYIGMSAGKSAEQLKAEGYVVWTPPHETGSFAGEGDTGTFLNLVDNGLRGFSGESFGGWGGYAGSGAPAPRLRGRAPTHRFLAAAQRSFANRFIWATTPVFAEANHEPHLDARSPHRVVARPGETVNLRVKARDPDKDFVAVRWWRWNEVDSYSGAVPLSRVEGSTTSLRVPADARAGMTIHVIAEATDNGVPALTRYARFVVRVR